MEIRELGKTGLQVGVVGVGTEHFVKASRADIDVMVRKAVDSGANFFDCISGEADVRDSLGSAFAGIRDKAVLAGHLGVYDDKGQIGITRDLKLSIDTFEDMLRRYRTDHVDVVNIIFADEPEDVDKVLAPGGLMDAAVKLKEQGKAKHIQVSCHRVPAALRFMGTGLVESLMFSVNPLFDMLPGDVVLDGLWKEESYTDTMHTDRLDMYHRCQEAGIGIVVMKPYAGGWLFAPNLYGNGTPLTAVQCIHYALIRPGVTTVACGVTNPGDLDAALAYAEASPEERSFARAMGTLKWKPGSLCLYCNHCLPCPAGIDIGRTLRTADSLARKHGADTGAAIMGTLFEAGNPGDCTSCGLCIARCPFGVDVPGRMAEAAKSFTAPA